MNVLATHAGVEPPAAGVRRIALNAASLLGAYILPRLFIVIGIVVAARVLGTARFGVYATAAAFAVILSITATLGMQALLVRDLARSPERAPALMRAAHYVKAGSTTLMLIMLVLLAAGPLDYSREMVLGAVLLGLAYAINAFVENLAAWAQAVERMHLWTEASAVGGLVTGLFGAALVWTTHSVVWFCLAPIAGQGAALAWLLARVPPEIRKGAPVQSGEVIRLVRALAPFTAAFLVLGLYYKLDVLLLERWRPTSDVGIYAAGHRFFDVAHALAIVAIGSAYPRLSRETGVGRNGQWAGTRTTELMLLGATIAAGMLWLARATAIDIVFGAQYAAAAPVLGWLALGMPALAINIAARFVLGTSARMDRVAILYAFGLAGNIILNYLWIPSLGAEGAARALAVCESLLAAGMLYALHTHSAALPRTRTWTAVAGAGALLFALSFAPDPTGGVLAALVFASLAISWFVITGALPAHERAALRAAFRFRS